MRKPVPKPAPRVRKAKKRLGSNPKRKREKFVRNFRSVERVEFGKMQPCAACSCAPTRDNPVENAHHQARGMGGCGGTYLDVVPLCRRCHHKQESAPVTFWKERNLNPVELATEHQYRWQAWAEQWGYPV